MKIKLLVFLKTIPQEKSKTQHIVIEKNK